MLGTVFHLSEENCRVVTSFKGVEHVVEVSAMISTVGIAQNTLDHILRGIEIEWNKINLCRQDKLNVLLTKSCGELFLMKQNQIFWLVRTNWAVQS